MDVSIHVAPLIETYTDDLSGPGVGKTYTAECCSEFVRRPLLTLTCNDIGTKAEVVEKKLAQFFERAKIWGAVILLDEADIYLEKRTLHDLERNGLVSAFLRSLEYFQGILFLTTNRVGTFDDAFLSRIHVAIHYEFDDKERTLVWKMFFDKLEDDLSDRIEVSESAREFIKHSSDLKNLEWNGREIRNGFQTAVALAESECLRDYEEKRHKKDVKRKKAVLKRDHFEQVVAMSKNFRQYLFKVHGNEPEKRAAASKERNEYVRRM
jgi:AAA+ superfamily predicted ATPase